MMGVNVTFKNICYIHVSPEHTFQNNSFIALVYFIFILPTFYKLTCFYIRYLEYIKLSKYVYVEGCGLHFRSVVDNLNQR